MFSKLLLDCIRRYRLDQGISIRSYARMSGVAERPLRSIDSPDWNPTLRTLEKIEAVIPPEFMQAANDAGDPVGAARADRGDDQRRAA